VFDCTDKFVLVYAMEAYKRINVYRDLFFTQQ
jgi:hypothetical protein